MGPPADSHMMPFGDHLDELRKRVVYALLGPIPLLVACLAAVVVTAGLRLLTG